MTLSTIQKYENNTLTPPIENLEKMAILYNTSLDYMRNLEYRKYIYLDDLSESKQKMILELVNSMREEEKLAKK